MMGETYGATAITSVSVGRTSACGCVHGLSPGAIWLTAGSQWKTEVENSMTSSTATTNSGSAASTSITEELAVSTIFSRLRAVQEPSAMDTGMEMIAAQATSTAVL